MSKYITIKGVRHIEISAKLAARYDSEDASVSDEAMAEIRGMANAAINAGAHQVEVTHPEGFIILSRER